MSVFTSRARGVNQSRPPLRHEHNSGSFAAMQGPIANTVNPSRFARLKAPFRGIFGFALDVALPTLCPACRELVRGEGLCASCWSKLSPIAPPYCERLVIPFAYDPGPGVLSMQAITDPPAYHRARAAVRYDEVARSLLHAL